MDGIDDFDLFLCANTTEAVIMCMYVQQNIQTIRCDGDENERISKKILGKQLFIVETHRTG